MSAFGFQQLETLLAVAKAGSFSAAARRANKPQSTISTHIGRLEEQVGRPLFRRSDGVLAITEDGEALARYARELINLRDQALARFGIGQHQSVVRVGMPDTMMTKRLLEAIWASPNMETDRARTETIIAPSRRLKKMLATGGLDVAIALRSQPEEGRLLWSERLTWVSASLAVVQSIRELSLVNYPPECPYRELIDNALLECALPHTNTYVGGSFDSIVTCISQGVGIGAMDRAYAAEHGLVPMENGPLPPLPAVEFCVLTNLSPKPGSFLQEVIDRLFKIRPAELDARPQAASHNDPVA